MPMPDVAATQFLPRIPVAPPPPPPPASVESTQFIPKFRPEPPAERRLPPPPPRPDPNPLSDVETTQHIPMLTGFEPDIESEEDTGTIAIPPAPRSHRLRNRLLVTLGALVVVIAVGVGIVFVSPSIATRLGLGSLAVPETSPPPSPVVYSARLKPPDTTGPIPTAAGVSSALAGVVANPALGAFRGTVLDAATGSVLWDHGSATPAAPASTNKVLTSAAALLSVGPQATLNTTVVAGGDPGTIILVGGGDPTLSSLPAPRQSVYPGAARMTDLAAQVKSHATAPITRILVDTGLYSGPLTGAGWDPETPTQDNYAPIQSVMMDGGRLNATIPDTPRTYQPALAAGQALASDLGLAPGIVSIATTATPQGTQPLGEVHSAPMSDLVTNLLRISDDVLAESVGRAVAISDHQTASFGGATQGVLDVLQHNGFATAGASLRDSSGLSPSDMLPPGLIAQVLRVAASPDTSDPRVAKLRPLLYGLPIAGSSVGDATLAGRYLTGPSSAGRGWVRAKTGTLSAQGVYALAGIVLDQAGRVLVFALNTNGGTGVAPSVLDDVTATLRGCGCG
jgi:D-alanyl-D-alanine carboxypeptidase/D-alanyl-D-alanine-endopeptidase (penicillin-binding protein 4)